MVGIKEGKAVLLHIRAELSASYSWKMLRRPVPARPTIPHSGHRCFEVSIVSNYSECVCIQEEFISIDLHAASMRVSMIFSTTRPRGRKLLYLCTLSRRSLFVAQLRQPRSSTGQHGAQPRHTIFDSRLGSHDSDADCLFAANLFARLPDKVAWI